MEQNLDRALSWDDEIEKESEFIKIEPGEYPFTVVNVEKGQYNGSEKMTPCPMAIVSVRLNVSGQEVTIKENMMLHTKMEWKLSQFFMAIGLKKKGEKTKMMWNSAIGRTGRLKTKIDNYQGREYVKVDTFIEPSDVQASQMTAPSAGFAPPTFG